MTGNPNINYLFKAELEIPIISKKDIIAKTKPNWL